MFFIAIFLHQGFHTDFYSYQYYNSWAFLTNRFESDFLAALFRSYYNPYLDVLHYFLVQNLNNHKFLYYFVLSLDCSISLILVYKISQNIIKKITKNWQIPVFLSIVYVAFTPIMYEVFTTGKNDLKIANLILLTFYFLLKNLFVQNSKKRDFFIFISGIISGIAFGLKLTVCVYIITFLLCILCLSKKIEKPVKTLLLFITGSFIAFLITDSYWMYLLWIHFQNPIFPHFNNIFKSPYAENILVWNDDYKFIRAQNLFQLIFYPFLYSKERAFGLCYECFDIRYAINLICTILLITKHFENQYYRFSALFVIFSYEINTFLFGTYRYICATSLLFGLILYLLLCKTYLSNVVMIFIILFALKMQNIPEQLFKYINLNKNTKYLVEYQNLELEDNSNVIILQHKNSYIVVNQNPKIRIYGFCMPKIIWDKIDKSNKYFGAGFFYSGYLEKKLKELLMSNEKVYLIIDWTIWREYKTEFIKSLEIYSNRERKIQNCKEIYFSPQKGMPQICELKRGEKNGK